MDSGPLNRRALLDAICIQRMQRIHVTCIYTITRDIVPHGEKQRYARIEGRGAVRICVTAPINLPGPTNLWALYLPSPCHVVPLTGVWVTRVASCHVSAPPAPCVGYARPCHVASVPCRIRVGPAHHVSVRATSAPRGL